MNYNERVKQWAKERGRAPSTPEEVAELIATIPRETVEECARVAESFQENRLTTREGRSMARCIYGAIRALLDAPQAEPLTYNEILPGKVRLHSTPQPEPRCGVCGFPANDWSHNDPSVGTQHDFEPEEPGQ